MWHNVPSCCSSLFVSNWLLLSHSATTQGYSFSDACPPAPAPVGPISPFLVLRNCFHLLLSFTITVKYWLPTFKSGSIKTKNAILSHRSNRNILIFYIDYFSKSIFTFSYLQWHVLFCTIYIVNLSLSCYRLILKNGYIVFYLKRDHI